MAVLAGLASLACLIVQIDRRRSVAPRAVDTAPARLGRAQEWELVMRRAGQDLSRAAELPALQARAAVKIEAAEHAFNRLAAECDRLCRTPAAPTALVPLPFPSRHATLPGKAEHQRLAA
jgi:hypothetical protein